ncbi:uncharacterized protein BDZ99DRAFT_464130 [Mytilinidion resinicola]|uniref:Uncharacterized protein n=1 Tax=Mytilinidion resinicola TaxID=574789 RepID=A0A6A6YI54_9PEZI|nr:uncharacterized protein BDZ99DRAFT_464130 [Mytilinidion resinicola]KAF2808238.1 hypothetical protein BDZ99DRAFT_464130 [Mytilinidion resinicola]
MPELLSTSATRIMANTQEPFSFLHENIPAWFKNVAEIEAKVAGLQSEITRVPVAAIPKKKTASTESIPVNDENAIGTIQEEDGTSGVARPTQMQLMKRKRKPGSVLSGHASGPIKYRSRTMIIVWYDSEVQKAFEALVRCIGTGRNLLRKGKMAAKMEALADMASAFDDDGDDDDSTAKVGYKPRVSGMPNFRSTRRMGGSGGAAGGDSGAKFDAADKELEKAQSLCERGAHQFLRDGDCRTELNAVRQHFAEVQNLSEQYMSSQSKMDTVTVDEVKVEVPKQLKPKPVQVPTITDRVPMASKAIEVDDDDDGEDWVLTPVRRTARG